MEKLGRRRVRRQRNADLLGTLRQDLLFALRQLGRYREFTVVAVLTLILGLGATTAIFRVVNGVLLRPFPYPAADRLVMVWTEYPEKGWTRANMSNPDIADVRAVDEVDFMEGYATSMFTLATDGRPLVVRGAFVTGGLLEMFGLHPERGRDIREEENRPGSAPVVVLAHDLWMSRFGADPGMLGRMIQIGDERYEVVGIAPRGFDFPERAELWVPHRHPCYGARGCRNLKAIATLAPGVELEPAQAALSALGASLRAEYPQYNPDVHFRYESLLDAVVGDVRTGLWILLGAVSLMLLVVCANLANLLLARAAGRREEMAVRTALGASRARLVEQLLVESLVLAGLGCAGGLGLAWGMVRAFSTSMAGAFPRAAEVTLDVHVLMFRALTGDPQSEVYVPLAQASSLYAQVLPDLTRELKTMRIHVRGATSGTDLLPLIRRQVEAVDPRIALSGVETVSQAMRRDAAPTRHQLQLMSLFAILAAILAGVGLYGIVSYMVSQREREIGIRQALGADGRTILTMVLGKGILPAAVGAVAGLLASLFLSRLVQSLLYHVAPIDPVVLGSVMLLVAVLAMAATLLPARAAARVDPAAALRVE